MMKFRKRNRKTVHDYYSMDSFACGFETRAPPSDSLATTANFISWNYVIVSDVFLLFLPELHTTFFLQQKRRMEFLTHTVSNMALQKLHSPYSIRNKNNHKHYVPLFPFTHPAHNENVRRLRAIVSPGSLLIFSVINRIGKEQKCAGLQNGCRSAKICRETLHDQHLPYSFLIYGRDTDAVSHKKHQSAHKLI